MQPVKVENIQNKLILCFYEGNAEKEILDMLLENNKLIFKRQDLIMQDFHKRIAGKKVGKKYLNFNFDKEVVIIRIIDSKNEKFVLSQPYKDLYKEIYTCRTCPEIEILLIMYHDDEVKFQSQKSKEGLKACEFCKKYYNYSKAKDEKYFSNHLTVEELIALLKKYADKHKSEYTIYSLIKE